MSKSLSSRYVFDPKKHLIDVTPTTTCRVLSATVQRSINPPKPFCPQQASAQRIQTAEHPPNPALTPGTPHMHPTDRCDTKGTRAAEVRRYTPNFRQLQNQAVNWQSEGKPKVPCNNHRKSQQKAFLKDQAKSAGFLAAVPSA